MAMDRTERLMLSTTVNKFRFDSPGNSKSSSRLPLVKSDTGIDEILVLLIRAVTGSVCIAIGIEFHISSPASCIGLKW